MVLSLLADIGGTNSRLALAEGPDLKPETIRHFRNADHSGLETILRLYLQGQNVARACVAVAGSVADGVGMLTNLDWKITPTSLCEASGAAEAVILNDLAAQGHALGHIMPANLRAIFGQPGEGCKLVVGVGTGFNASPVHDGPWGRVVPSSECGHAGLPLRSSADLRLADFLQAAHGFAAVEDALSGRGLERLFSFVTTEAGQAQKLSAAEIMARLATENGVGMATDTARLFLRLLGAELGNLALTHLPFGGIFLIGGVARAFAPYMEDMGLRTAFQDKGRFAPLMEKFSLSLVEDDDAALIGCALYLASGTRG